MHHVNSKHDTHELRIASWNVRSLTLNKPKQLAALAGACVRNIAPPTAFTLLTHTVTASPTLGGGPERPGADRSDEAYTDV